MRKASTMPTKTDHAISPGARAIADARGTYHSARAVQPGPSSGRIRGSLSQPDHKRSATNPTERCRDPCRWSQLACSAGVAGGGRPDQDEDAEFEAQVPGRVKAAAPCSHPSSSIETDERTSSSAKVHIEAAFVAIRAVTLRSLKK